MSTIAATEPRAAFAGFLFGLKHRCTYFMRTIPNISQNLKQLEKASEISLSNPYSMIMNPMNARVDVSTRGFWDSGQLAFSDIRVFNPLAKCYNAKHLKSIFTIHEKEKKKKLQSENHCNGKWLLHAVSICMY